MFQLQHLLHGIDSLRTTHIIFIGKISIHIIIQFNFLRVMVGGTRYFIIGIQIIFIKSPLYWHANESAKIFLDFKTSGISYFFSSLYWVEVGLSCIALSF